MSYNGLLTVVAFAASMFLNGCTSMPDDQVIQDGIVSNNVSQENKFYQNVSLGEASGFEGTSVFFNMSPDMDNDTALLNLQEALQRNMLFSPAGDYRVDIRVLDNGACDKGLSLIPHCEGGGYTYIRKTVDVVYDILKDEEQVDEINVVTSGRSDSGFLIYGKEKGATEEAYANNLNEFIKQLIEIGQ